MQTSCEYKLQKAAETDQQRRVQEARRSGNIRSHHDGARRGCKDGPGAIRCLDRGNQASEWKMRKAQRNPLGRRARMYISASTNMYTKRPGDGSALEAQQNSDALHIVYPKPFD